MSHLTTRPPARYFASAWRIVFSGGLLLAFLMLLPPHGAAQNETAALLPPVSAEAGRAVPCATGCGTDTFLPPTQSAFEEELLARLNRVRADNALPPLRRHPGLLQSARFHARDMGEDNYFQYDTYDWINDQLTFVCRWDTRISRSYGPYTRLTESIAAGYTTPAAVLEAWLAHPGHRANLLDPAVREVGIGYVFSSTAYYQHYWVLDFGRLDARYPLVINHDASTTITPTVQLYLYGQGVFTEMRLRNNDEPWGAWQAFRADVGWTLPESPGLHTVWAELRNASSTTVTSDTITLLRPSLAPLPAAVQFVYPLDRAAFIPPTATLTLSNPTTADVLTWEASAQGDWFSLTPLSGTTPAQLVITPRLPLTPTAGWYQGALTVTVTSPITTLQRVQRVALRLLISPTYPPFSLYLPAVVRAYPQTIQPRTPNDVFYAQQWALTRLQAPLAWGAARGDGVLVAVLDTGVDYAHPDLQGKCRMDIDYDFVNRDEDASDDQGHGTHVAGIIAAATDNKRGVAALGWNAQIVALKVMRPTETGQTTGTLGDVVQAIYYATDHGARIINLSLGSDPSQNMRCSAPEYAFLREALRYAYDRGVLVFAAAGNAAGNADAVIPVNCPYVIGVAATNSSDVVAGFSNRGQAVDVAAPGVSILSTVRNGLYEYWDGTSMATPHAAAVAALIWSRNPTWPASRVAAALLDTAEDIGPAGVDTASGCGRLNAARAVITGTLSLTPQCKSSVFEAPPTVQALDGIPTAGGFVPGTLLVRWSAARSFQNAPLAAFGIQGEERLYGGLWRVRVPAGAELSIAQQLRDAGLVELVTPEVVLSGF